jgi:PBP1b-binding outer membrane lipoprotein LpoB
MVLTGCASKPNTDQESTEQKPTVSVHTPKDSTDFIRNAEKRMENWRLKEQKLLQVLEP